MTEEQLAALEALVAVRAGRYHIQDAPMAEVDTRTRAVIASWPGIFVNVTYPDGQGDNLAQMCNCEDNDPDYVAMARREAAYIVAACNALPDLLAALRRRENGA